MLKVFIFSLFISSGITAKEIGPKLLKIASQEWPPYHYQNIDGKVVGKAVDVLECILNKMDQKYEITIYPWMRAQVNTKDGITDAFFSASHSKKRDRFAVHSKVFINQDWYFYFLKKEVQIKNKSEVRDNFLVGARMNSNVKNWLLVNGYKVSGKYSTSKKMLDLLVKSRIKVYMENEEVFNASLKESNLSKKDFGRVFNKSHHLGVYFGKKFTTKYPSFLKEFNKNVNDCSLLK